jgi:hypothetical protein
MTITDKSIYTYPTLIITFDVVDADQIVLSFKQKLSPNSKETDSLSELILPRQVDSHMAVRLQKSTFGP